MFERRKLRKAHEAAAVIREGLTQLRDQSGLAFNFKERELDGTAFCADTNIKVKLPDDPSFSRRDKSPKERNIRITVAKNGRITLTGEFYIAAVRGSPGVQSAIFSDVEYSSKRKGAAKRVVGRITRKVKEKGLMPQ